MGAPLPAVSREDFGRRLGGHGLSPAGLEALFGHYELLRRWNRVHALIGPTSAEEVVERHYVDALRALPLLAPLGAGSRLLDVGSGAGFPGFVLAAARPDLRVTLLEPRQKKAAFLRQAARSTGVSLEVVVGRIEDPLPEALPEAVDCVTLRALKLDAEGWRLLSSRLTPEGRILVWAGRALPDLPSDLQVLETHDGETETGILAVLAVKRPPRHGDSRPA